MKVRTNAIAVAAAAALGAASPASAVTMIFKAEGTVKEIRNFGGFEHAGLPLPFDLPITGKPFTLSYRYDSDDIVSYPGELSYSGSNVAAKLTIGDQSRTYKFANLSALFQSDVGAPYDIIEIDLSSDDHYLEFDLVVPPGTIPYTAPGAGNFAPAGGPASLSYLLVFQPTIEFDVDQITVSTVPEPSIWALLIAGLGLAGASLRSRRRGLA